MSEHMVTMTRSELSELVVDAVKEAMSAIEVRGEEWMTPDEVARLTGYCRTYISQLVRYKGLPAHVLGRKQRFRRSDVMQWMESRRSG